MDEKQCGPLEKGAKPFRSLSLSAFIVQILIVYSRNIFMLKSIDRPGRAALLFLPFSCEAADFPQSQKGLRVTHCFVPRLIAHTRASKIYV
jgi:hypothetical protein